VADVDAVFAKELQSATTLIAGGVETRASGEPVKPKIIIKEGSVAVMRCWSKIRLREPREQSRLEP